MNYEKKYTKYKMKYLNLKKQLANAKIYIGVTTKDSNNVFTTSTTSINLPILNKKGEIAIDKANVKLLLNAILKENNIDENKIKQIIKSFIK